jgi:hypothetical protein
MFGDLDEAEGFDPFVRLSQGCKRPDQVVGSFQVCRVRSQSVTSSRIVDSHALIRLVTWMYSGLPLLDLLKDLNVTPESSSMGLSTAEDWITMSTASGLRGFPMTSDIGSIGSTSRVSQHDIKTTRSTLEEGRSEDLWPRITDIVGQSLLDA